MSQVYFRRHDLVWLDPAMHSAWFASDGEADPARTWIKRGFPLVVARQTEDHACLSDQIILGFTLPSAPVRTRVSLRANRAAIIRHARPLLLADAIDHAPKSWRDSLKLLHVLFTNTVTEARTYGSLSSQIFTGMNYLDEKSDLDLLLECGEITKLRELLLALESFSPNHPRLDGEIVFPSGWAVAWREFAVALRNGVPRKVLAKSDREISLVSVEDLNQDLLTGA